MATKVDIIVDLQFGSTGKGLIAGYLAEKRGYDVVICANMPNAGHTYIDCQGQKMVHKVLPSGVVSPSLKVAMIGPGSVFSIDRLVFELDYLDDIGYRDIQVIIHPNAVVLAQRHVEREEQSGMKSIGSTVQGAGAAMIEKIKRSVGNIDLLARHWQVGIRQMTGGRARVSNHQGYNRIIKDAKRILVEGSQGYSLGINQRFWPYCTSRECTPARFLSDVGIPISYLNEVIGVARVHPIRVGGASGGWYDDQEEITWESIGQEPELTTVTERERRVFSFSYNQVDDAIWECGVDNMFLNFCNYDEKLAESIAERYKDYVMWLGHGPSFHDIQDGRNG